MKVLGKSLREGRFASRAAKARLEITVERTNFGFLIGGTVSGRPGRIEIFRLPAPPVFLMNNWQSWGPVQKARPADRFPELEAIYRNYSPYVFSPGPEILGRGPESDYFVAWEGNVLGFLASRIAHPFFAVEGSDMVAYLDYFEAGFKDPVPLEPLGLFAGRPVEDLLDGYAALVARENRVRLSPWNPVGWCSWYHYFGNLGWGDVLENLRIARKNPRSFPFEVFQVDDGYESEIGDWTRAKPGYPDLAGLARAIREKGFRAGIWTAPTSAAESSELFGGHPEWMVAEEGRPKKSYRGWGKTIYALDTTSGEAKEWLFRIFRALKKAGFEYFKIDFLFSAAMPGNRKRNVTPIQAYREGLRTIREAVGRSFVLGCGAPLLPSVGFVDGMRIGEDTAPTWKTKPSGFQGPSAYFALKNALLRQFMHRRLWTNDPDCLLLRSQQTELMEGERELFALAAGALDNMLVLSDDLSLVDDRGKRLFRKALGLRGGKSRVLGLLEDDAYVVASRGGPAGDIELRINLSDRAAEIRGTAVGPRRGRLILSPVPATFSRRGGNTP